MKGQGHKSYRGDEVIIPMYTREVKPAWMHIYSIRSQMYFNVSYHKTGICKASDVIKHCLLIPDAALIIGAAMFVILEGKHLAQASKKQALKYLDRYSLQLAINSAFETSELTFSRMAEKYSEQSVKRARKRLKKIEEGGEK